MSLLGDKFAVVHHCLETGDTDVYAVQDKTAEAAEESYRDFLGPERQIRSLHSDSAPELIKAARNIGLFHRSIAPGFPQANGIAERQVKFVLEGARTILEHAGLPHSLWPEACHFICMARRIAIYGGDSIWRKKFKKGNFKGKTFCFGERVMFIPSPILDGKKSDKWAGKERPGVFP